MMELRQQELSSKSQTVNKSEDLGSDSLTVHLIVPRM